MVFFTMALHQLRYLWMEVVGQFLAQNIKQKLIKFMKTFELNQVSIHNFCRQKYDKTQDRGQKIVSFKVKIHGACNINVIKLLQSLYCS